MKFVPSDELEFFRDLLERTQTQLLEVEHLVTSLQDRCTTIQAILGHVELLKESPLCPRCEAKTVIRNNRDGARFYGCTNFTKTGCRGSVPLHKNLKRVENEPLVIHGEPEVQSSE